MINTVNTTYHPMFRSVIYGTSKQTSKSVFNFVRVNTFNYLGIVSHGVYGQVKLAADGNR